MFRLLGLAACASFELLLGFVSQWNKIPADWSKYRKLEFAAVADIGTWNLLQSAAADIGTWNLFQSAAADIGTWNLFQSAAADIGSWNLLQSAVADIGSWKFCCSFDRTSCNKFNNWPDQYYQPGYRNPYLLFSSTEPKAQWWAYRIGRLLSSICMCLCQDFQRSFPQNPLGQSKPNFIWSLLEVGEQKCSNGPDHITKMAQMW